MESRSTTAAHAAAILNDWWMVRNYVRGGRSEIQRKERDEAILNLGATIQRAFSACPKTPRDYEALIAAVLDGGRPRDEQPF